MKTTLPSAMTSSVTEQEATVGSNTCDLSKNIAFPVINGHEDIHRFVCGGWPAHVLRLRPVTGCEPTYAGFLRLVATCVIFDINHPLLLLRGGIQRDVTDQSWHGLCEEALPVSILNSSFHVLCGKRFINKYVVFGMRCVNVGPTS